MTHRSGSRKFNPRILYFRLNQNPSSSYERNISFFRYYCLGKKCDDGFGQWTDEIEYLDESGSVLYSGKGLRSVEPGVDDHVMVGELKKPFLNASAVAKIVEVVKRWKWGLELETQLDKLQFHPNMTRITQALKIINESDASLSLFRWAKRKSCYSPSDDCYMMLFDWLNRDRDFNEIQLLFDEMVQDSSNDGKAQESGYKVDTQTFNALMTLFLNKGLPFKAFEIYESMEVAGCLLDESTYELMIPNLAKSSRLDAASKPFQEMKEWKLRPSLSVLASLIDSMGKAGRLDASMKVYKEAQGCGLRSSSAIMYVSLIESFAKAGKLDSTLRLWDNMKKAGYRPNFGLYTLIIESHAKSGKLGIAMSAFKDMEKAGFLPTPSTYSSLLEMHAASGQVDSAVKLYNSITNAGLRPGLSNYTSPLTLLANKNLVDVAAKVLLEMKSMGFSVDVRASDVLMAEQNERHLMSILSATRHKAHAFMCGLFTGPEERKQPVLSFINRARPVWKVAYENKLFAEAIVFNQQIAWFRKRTLNYGVIPRRIKLVTGPTLKIVVAQRLNSVESPFEVSKIVLRATGDSVMEWFKKPIVQQLLLNEIPSRTDILMHKLNILFPSFAPEVRSFVPS
ncbi:hypothetical protein SLEP1_g9768 [Rubroshorea leprosula]|uniref:PROP1-like PPR domain-containing protein n=1 Tax=Rubroshorea leprosula TaxID=152421 RepID=A0AAV5IDW6_9ROSI|nr:hypothetical protein SLEP1_g9768 [Rubroshorea leprosula]